ncbi:MAG: ComEC family competence protein [Cyclobacteriaceae bacterium]|nr:ComEC family competence protein [Cyclobacteriaceae bacterium]
MIQWTPYAFVRITLFYVTGVLVGKSWALDPVLVWPLVVLVVVAYIVLATTKRKRVSGVISGTLGLASILLLGCASGGRTMVLPADHISHYADSITHFAGVVTSYPSRSSRTWKVVLDVRSVRVRKAWKGASGKVMLYLDLDAYPSPFTYGDVLFITGGPRGVPGPANPEAFDYRRFLALRHIHHQHYVGGNNDAVRIGNDPPSPIMARAIAAREKAVEVFRRYVRGTREHAVACALVLGYKEDLDDDLSDAFAASGTLHVLAVSGLHVGILYGLVMVMLKPVRKMRGGKWTVALCGIAVLWSYAFITGLSPSVLRAAMMCSVVTLAGPWGRRSSMYNTFAVSAFALLVHDPNLIYSVGFQLSYAAVFGIVRFYPPLVRLWEPSSWIVSRIWQMSCVSFAAQLATFPLALYYFHQFPVWFLLANLVAIPLSFVILVTGLVTLAAAIWPAAAMVCGYALHGAVWLLNRSVELTADLPLSVIDGIYISSFQCWILGGIVAVIATLITHRSFGLVCAAAVLCFAFAADGWVRTFENSSVKEVIVYHLRNGYGMEFREAFHSYFFADSVHSRNADAVAYHTAGYRMTAGIRSVEAGASQPFVREFDAGRLIHWNDYTIIHIFSGGLKWPAHLDVDCVVVSRNALRTLDDLPEGVTLSQVVVDGSNSPFVVARMEREAVSRGIPFHATSKSGAFIKKIQ